MILNCWRYDSIISLGFFDSIFLDPFGYYFEFHSTTHRPDAPRTIEWFSGGRLGLSGPGFGVSLWGPFPKP